MAQIITVEDDLPFFDFSEPWTCGFKNCMKNAYVLVFADEEILALMGIPKCPNEKIVRIALCPEHHREYQNLKKLRETTTLSDNP